MRKTMSGQLTPGERFAAGELTEAELLELARESALKTLTAAPKSRAELESTLRRKGYPDQVILPLLNRFETVGLLNDAEYAAQVTRARFKERSQSRRAIAVELKRRGVNDQVARVALGAINEQDERVALHELALKLAERSVGLAETVRLRRLVAALGRRGYSSEQVFEVARSALSTNSGNE